MAKNTIRKTKTVYQLWYDFGNGKELLEEYDTYTDAVDAADDYWYEQKMIVDIKRARKEITANAFNDFTGD